MCALMSSWPECSCDTDQLTPLTVALSSASDSITVSRELCMPRICSRVLTSSLLLSTEGGSAAAAGSALAPPAVGAVLTVSD